jgi:hypothetical protein
MPHFQLQQVPETRRVVSNMITVLLDEGLDLISPKVAAVQRTPVEQDLGR